MPEPIRNRITGYQLINKSDLVLHAAHVWEHPDEEKQRLAKVVDERGNTSVLLVRKLPTGKFEIIDGKMRFENIPLESYSCILCDLDDDEAEAETREHNILGHQSITTDAALLAQMKSVASQVPDPESLLRKSPQIEGQSTTDAGQTAGPTTGTPLRREVKEKKVEQSGTHLYVLLVIPLAKFADAQPHISELEKLAGITVQRTSDAEVTA